jgi:hypothetical protein
MTRVNPQKISNNITYTIKELMVHLCLNQKTFLRWIDNGLKVVPGGKNPILILGADLKEFLRHKNLKNKRGKLKENEFNCLTCKHARRAKRGSITQKRNVKKAVCSVCNGKMCRTFKLEQKDYPISSNPTQMSMLELLANNH